ncbi:MAG: bifunctional hydroxymethylpyrimidine kinase/phosphomethylpyrimidine kinase [Lentisphaerae bacterium]|nr:bifunctional hydroxymethylpyrimidine kinase/phosphomethylpyrimidine kinase [Lentisphaerota bacterium]
MTKRSKTKFYPVAMTIAGSDSGGGAGIAADLRTFNALGVFGTCAITAVTSQNPAAVRRIDALDAGAVTAQIDAVCEKIAVKYVKTGMLYSSAVISAVAGAVKKHDFILVCDPLMVSTSGHKLLQDEAIETVKSELLPLASWITPNIPEAELLTGCRISGVADMLTAAGKLSEQYPGAIWLKGGHLSGNAGVDVIIRDGRKYIISAPELPLPPFASHGTGCTLSAALTAMLPLDLSWKQAVCGSKAFVYGSLAQTVEIGPGVNAMYPPLDDYSSMIKLEAQDD